jgi:hypothetical protein
MFVLSSIELPARPTSPMGRGMRDRLEPVIIWPHLLPFAEVRASRDLSAPKAQVGITFSIVDMDMGVAMYFRRS